MLKSKQGAHDLEQLTIKRFLATRWSTLIYAVREWAFFESVSIRAFLGAASMVGGLLLLLSGRGVRGAEFLARAHRGDFHPAVSRLAERLFRKAIAGEGGWVTKQLRDAILRYPNEIRPTSHTQRFFDDPQRLLSGCALVVKSPTESERGVLYLYYSYVYPLILKKFDIEAIEKRYHIVVEPSWSGYCDLNILCLTALKNPVFVGSIEPRDTKFLESTGAGLIPVYVGGNTWIDAGIFKPLPGIPKDIDLIYIGSWAAYKRHWALFKALSIIKQRGRRVRVALVGYPIDLSIQRILEQAKAFGVGDLVEFYEKLTPTEVNELLNRSKVNVLWSRREGVNRAIIEGMAAGTPCIVRRGFNYGYHYPYINAKSGCFATENQLPDAIVEMLERHESMTPRDSVVPVMTPEASTQRLNDAIKRTALALGETWTKDIAVRVGTIHGLGYRTPEEKSLFSQDYAFLASTIVP